MTLLVKDIQCCLGLPPTSLAVGHCISDGADLAKEDLPEKQIDPWVQDLVEGRHADGCQKKVTVCLDLRASGLTGGQH